MMLFQHQRSCAFSASSSSLNPLFLRSSSILFQQVAQNSRPSDLFRVLGTFSVTRSAAPFAGVRVVRSRHAVGQIFVHDLPRRYSSSRRFLVRSGKGGQGGTLPRPRTLRTRTMMRKTTRARKKRIFFQKQTKKNS
jgi:hypothetical protein